MSSDVVKLLRLRAGSKSVCTKELQKLDAVIQSKEEVAMTQLLKRLTSLLTTIRGYDENILDLLSVDAVEDEIAKHNEYNMLVEDAMVRLEIALKKVKQGGAVKKQEVKLPTISLATFDGDPKRWTGFWELFKCAVDDRADLTDIQKFSYLKGQMQGEALTLIGGFSMEAASYEPAHKLLKDTYGQEDQIKAAHIISLLELAAPEYNVKSLKNFHASFSCILKVIETSNITLDEVCTVLLAQKLPVHLRENIRRELKGDWLTLGRFTETFLKEVQTMEGSEQSSRKSLASAAFSLHQSVAKTVTPQGGASPRNCKLCQKPGHYWVKCKQYKYGSEKVNRAKGLGLCTICLSSDHMKDGCNQSELKSCKFCKKKHLFGLCATHVKKVKTVTSPVNGENSTSTTLATTGSSKRRTLLPTCMVPLCQKGGGVVSVRTMMDQCSEHSFLLSSYLEQVEHEIVDKIQLRLESFTEVTEPKECNVALVKFKHRNRQRPLRVIVVDRLPSYRSPAGLKAVCDSLIKKGFKLADPNVSSNGELGMLIGGDHYYDIIHTNHVKEDNSVLLPTIYGYALSGKFAVEDDGNSNVEVVTVLKVATHPIEHVLNKDIDSKEVESLPEIKDLNALWELDHVGIKSTEVSNRAKDILRKFEDTVRYNPGNKQYTVQLPWRSSKKHLLPTNFKLALGRLRGLQKKFKSNPEFCNQYSTIIQEQEDRGFIEQVSSKESNNANRMIHYLPHQGVKKDSATTPVRVVYDCSARTGPKSLSLNDCLHTGPTLVADLTQMLLRFRLDEFAWVSDVEKAYLMIRLAEEDQDCTRFLWPKEPMNVNSEFTIYKFKVVLFGATCSQFLLNAVIKQHLKQSENTEPYLVKKLQRGLYIDNLQGTGSSLEDLSKQVVAAIDTFSEAHLTLRSWVSNCPKLREEFSIKGIAAKETKDVKVLGVNWDTFSDALSLQTSAGETETIHTKREALSVTAKVYDPMGWVIPVSIRARLLMQQLWKVKIDWDEPLPEHLKVEWVKMLKDLKDVLKVTVPRQVCEGGMVILHIFSDASTKAYGATAYFSSNKGSRLVMAKGKVAPIKTLTVPKLELTALVMAVRLAKFVKEAYDGELSIQETHLWCDSQIALAWLNSDKDLITYVQNRVDEVKESVSPSQVHYVPTKENPSDLLTRGISGNCLLKSKLWWNGPDWLPLSKDWPVQPALKEKETQAVLATVDTPMKSPESTLVNWSRFSTFGRLTRVVAWVLRFIKRCRKMNVPSTDYVQVSEIKEAEVKIISLVQKEMYSQEHTSLSTNRGKKSIPLVTQLGLYLDGEIIKCTGRLQRTVLSENIKKPVLLPSKHRVTTLIVEAAHKYCMHFGVGYVTSYLRTKYWIPKIRQVVKKVQYKCVTCKRLQGSKYAQAPEPPLPDVRVQQVAPFQVTGIDYTGAINVKGVNKEEEKAYILLFTCTVTRGIHLEVVQDMSCDTFIHAFRRFCSRRGFPQMLLSDNATTFHSGAKVLQELMENEKVINWMTTVKCEWKFIPVKAPWYGAIWERCIGIVKAGIKKVLWRALVTVEELKTVLLELEAAVNDRPLSYVYSDLNEPLPVSPSLLMYGRQLRTFPRYQIEDEDVEDPNWGNEEYMSRRAKYIMKLSNDMWKKWVFDYLLSLRERGKKKIARSGGVWPKEGDVVLIQDEGPRLFWKLGVVTQLKQGLDGYTRVAEIRLTKGTTIRSVRHLYPLEMSVEVKGDEDSNIVSIPTSASNREQADGTGSVVKSRTVRQAAQKSSQLWQSLARQGQV